MYIHVRIPKWIDGGVLKTEYLKVNFLKFNYPTFYVRLFGVRSIEFYYVVNRGEQRIKHITLQGKTNKLT